MNNRESKRLAVVKFGSNSVLPDGKEIQEMEENISGLLWDLLRDENTDIIIVSSGAVKYGRKITGKRHLGQDRAACIGQPRLIQFWDTIVDPFREGSVGQVLVDYNTKQDKAHYTTIKDLLIEGVVPVVNFNDADSNQELKEISKFQDNDHTLEYIVHLFANFSSYKDVIPVIYSHTPFMKKNGNGELDISINEIDVNLWSYSDIDRSLDAGVSTGGTGGMNSKVKILYDLVNDGYTTSGIISDTKTRLQDLLRCLDNGETLDYATFIRK